MALWSGWFAVLLIVISAAVPLGARLRMGLRASPSSPAIRRHVVLGLTTSAVAFLHTLFVIPALGSPAAIGSGPMAIAPAGLAFFLLVAHSGLGLQLREERLKTRAKIRRFHAVTALAITISVAIHVVTLEQARH